MALRKVVCWWTLTCDPLLLSIHPGKKKWASGALGITVRFMDHCLMLKLMSSGKVCRDKYPLDRLFWSLLESRLIVLHPFLSVYLGANSVLVRVPVSWASLIGGSDYSYLFFISGFSSLRRGIHACHAQSFAWTGGTLWQADGLARCISYQQL